MLERVRESVSELLLVPSKQLVDKVACAIVLGTPKREAIQVGSDLLLQGSRAKLIIDIDFLSLTNQQGASSQVAWATRVAPTSLIF